MTFDRWQTFVSDDLRLKTTIDGRQPLVEDNLVRNTILNGRQHLIKDNVEDDLWSKTDGLKICFYTLLCQIVLVLVIFTSLLHFQVEKLFTNELEKGNRKKAMNRLKVTTTLNTTIWVKIQYSCIPGSSIWYPEDWLDHLAGRLWWWLFLRPVCCIDSLWSCDAPGKDHKYHRREHF